MITEWYLSLSLSWNTDAHHHHRRYPTGCAGRGEGRAAAAVGEETRKARRWDVMCTS